MDIKKIIKLSFAFIIGLIVIISTVNLYVLKKIENNYHSKNLISSLISIQQDMNTLVLDSLIVENQTNLNQIERKFLDEEKKFLNIKKELTNKKDTRFTDSLIQDIDKDKIVLNDLNILYSNVNTIKDGFKKIYTLQKEKISIKKSFKENYPLENKIRKEIQVIIWTYENIDILKNFAELKYYSKEALYQHKNELYLNKWLNKAIELHDATKIKLFKKYIHVVKTLSKQIVQIENIQEEEVLLTKKIQEVLNLNSTLNKSIHQSIEEVLNDFIKINNLLIFSLSILTIIFLIILALKVYKNVGLSIDDINNKVKNGTKEIKKLSKEIETTQKEVVFTMGAIGESRSKETGNHVKRVAEYSKLFALYYGLKEVEAEMLKQASPMHDIGKVAIPDSILNKPGRFDEKEREIMNTHAELGYEMLKSSNRPLLKAASTVALEHHEKWDGTGYPKGLKGEDIHIYGRITALADVFDALGSDRVYKKAWNDEKIFNLFREEREKHFDPKLVDIFFEHLNEFLEIRNTFKDIDS